MEKKKPAGSATEPEAKKKGGRKPMTAAEKAAAAKARAESKAKADNLKPTVIVQFQGSEVELDTLVEAAKADFRQEKKRTPITDLKLYVKPAERMAYYVINEKYNGAFTEGDRVLLNALHTKLMANKKLASMAKTSDPQIFAESIFPKAFGDAAQDSYMEAQDTYTALFEDQAKYNAIMRALAEVIYREMRTL